MQNKECSTFSLPVSSITLAASVSTPTVTYLPKQLLVKSESHHDNLNNQNIDITLKKHIKDEHSDEEKFDDYRGTEKLPQQFSKLDVNKRILEEDVKSNG